MPRSVMARALERPLPKPRLYLGVLGSLLKETTMYDEVLGILNKRRNVVNNMLEEYSNRPPQVHPEKTNDHSAYNRTYLKGRLTELEFAIDLLNKLGER